MNKDKAFTFWGTVMALTILIMIVALLNYPSESAITGAVAIDFGYGHYGLAWAIIIVIFLLAVYMEFFEGKKGEKTKALLEERIEKAAKEIKKQF